MTFLAGRLAQTHCRLAALTLVAGLAATPAEAAQLLFELTGDVEATFVLDQSPVPDDVEAVRFTLAGPISGTLNGADVEFTQFRFYISANGGGLAAFITGDGFSLFGPQLFSGPTAAPTFTPGAYVLTDSLGGGDYALTIGNAVPEPASWALLILGFGAVGAVLRRREILRAS